MSIYSTESCLRGETYCALRHRSRKSSVRLLFHGFLTECNANSASRNFKIRRLFHSVVFFYLLRQN
jgi:hypothetical protein